MGPFRGLLVFLGRVGDAGSSPHPVELLPGPSVAEQVPQTPQGQRGRPSGCTRWHCRPLGPGVEGMTSVFLVHRGVLAVLWRNSFFRSKQYITLSLVNVPNHV